MTQREFDPVLHLTANAIGAPGQRTFLLQAASPTDQLTVLLEKQQAQALAERIEEWLPLLHAQVPEQPGDSSPGPDAGALLEPLVPAFRVEELTLHFEPERDRVLLTLRGSGPAEQQSTIPGDDLLGLSADTALGFQEPEEQVLHLWLTRAQLRALGQRAQAAVQGGRPQCPLCMRPMDPSGHVCPALNGHGHHPPTM